MPSRPPPNRPLGVRRDHEPPAADESSWSDLSTEARHPASGDLDRLSSEEIVALVLEEDRRGLARALGERRAIARVADWVAETLAAGGTVAFAGAGTSGRLGVLEAAECPPTFGTDPDRVRALMAGGPEAVFRAREGAEDREDEGRRAAAGFAAGDLVVALSASSVTPFARGALTEARNRGARTVLLTCATGARLAGAGLAGGGRGGAGPGREGGGDEAQGAGAQGAAADLVLALDTGPEVLTGSTRLKAGSVTKAVLNAVTTAAMVRLGKVFENLMVDLRPGSAKLRDRAVRIVETAGGVPREEAEAMLGAAGGEPKTAILMARLGLPAEAARERLAAAGGHLRRALEGA